MDGFMGLRILRNLSETESFSCHCGTVFKTPLRLQEHYDIFHSCSSVFIDLNGDVLWRDYNANKKKTRRKVGPLCYQKMLPTRLPSIEEESVSENDDADDEGNKITDTNTNVQLPSPYFSNPASAIQSESEPERITNDSDEPFDSSKESAFSSEKSPTPTVSHHDTEKILEKSKIMVEKHRGGEAGGGDMQSPPNQCMTLSRINLQTGKIEYNCGSSVCHVEKTVSLPSANITRRKTTEELSPNERTKVGMEDFYIQDEQNNTRPARRSSQNYTNIFSQNLVSSTGNFGIHNVGLEKNQGDTNNININTLEKPTCHRNVIFPTGSGRGEMYGNWSVVKCEPVAEIETHVSKFSGHGQNPIYNSLELQDIQNSGNIPLHSHHHYPNQHHDQSSLDLDSLNTMPIMRNDSLHTLETFSHLNSSREEAIQADALRTDQVDKETRNESFLSTPIPIPTPIRMKIEDGYSIISEGDCNFPSSSSSSLTMAHFHNDLGGDQDEDDIYLSCQETVVGSMAKSPELPSDDMETTSRRRTKRKKSFDVSRTEPRSLRSLPGRPKRFCS